MSKSSLPTPHSGHSHLSGPLFHLLRDMKPCSGAPTATSWMKLQITHWHVFIMSDYFRCWSAGFQRLSKSALLITLTELNAIAAPATIGLSKPNAASGMPTRL
ncbi:hypothetical protein BH11PSE11_BH11PSE11_16050 [soil metagenome]